MASETVNELRKMSYKTSVARSWNGNTDSLQAIAEFLKRMGRNSGITYYVDDTSGDDIDDGLSPDTAFATVAVGLAALSAGDTLVVKAATYDEAGMTNSTNNVTLVLEPGVILTDSTPGVGFTNTGDDCVVIGGQINIAGQIGLVQAGGSCVFIDVWSNGCATGFDQNGPDCVMLNCRSTGHTTTGFAIAGTDGYYRTCLAPGHNAAVRGFYLDNTSAHNNAFYECMGFGNTTSDFETVAGADYNIFAGCYASSEPVNAGTGNVFPNYSIGSQITAGQSRDQDIKDIYDALAGGATWEPEEQQTGTVTMTAQNTWYSVFTAYSSTDYIVKGSVNLDFDPSQTYEVRLTYGAVGASNGPTTQYVIGATDTARMIQILNTPYLDLEVRCTTAAGQTADYYRNLEYQKDSGSAAPT